MQFHAIRFIYALIGNWRAETTMMMKKLILALIAMSLSIGLQAKQDVTKFLGIPVEGNKFAMIRKLEKKGFKPVEGEKNMLKGVFNRTPVTVIVGTKDDGKKVRGILVCEHDKKDAVAIKKRFNDLCRQFEKNPKYLSSDTQVIPEYEDIEDGIKNGKQYTASYFQYVPIDTAMMMEKYRPYILGKYTPEQLEYVSEDEINYEVADLILQNIVKSCSQRRVSVTIAESDFIGKYFIAIYYAGEPVPIVDEEINDDL